MMVFYFATSSIVGIDDDDPLRVTVIDEAREANFKVSSISNPRTSPEIKYPLFLRDVLQHGDVLLLLQNALRH